MCLDVGPKRLGDAQAVEGKQRDQGMVSGPAQPDRDEQRTELVAVQTHGVGLHVDAWTAHVGGRGVLDEALLLGIAVEAHDRAQAAGDGGARPALGLEVPTEALDVCSAHSEEGDVVLRAPGGELAQVEPVGVAGQPAVAGPGSRRGRVARTG